MATAYLATQTSLGRQVVLKVLDTSVADAQAVIDRFVNEGRTVASLQHPNIITIYDIGTSGDDVYISMEYVDGGDLKQRIAERIFSPDEAIELLTKIASALAAAHAKGIVHRDVKPGNILFRGDGTPLLSDFGIAKRLSGDLDLTRTGMFVGSPNYMSPEQSGLSPIDQRADIYSLGVIFFEILMGAKPFTADSVIDVILMHKHDPIPALPSELEKYQELLGLMLAKSRNDRFQNAESLLHYIEKLPSHPRDRLNDEPITAASPRDPSEQPTIEAGQVTRLNLEPAQRHKSRAALLVIASVCGLLYAGLLLIERHMMQQDIPGSVALNASIELLPIAPPGAAPAYENDEEFEKVAAALRWLGSHSLNEFRLTAPPQDNAYYYYSRLLQMNSKDEIARQGLRQIAERYAMLAEREVADGNRQQASRYLAIGLHVDPSNEALSELQGLVGGSEPGIAGFLSRIFQ